MRARAWKRRPWPTATPRWTSVSRCCRCSTRWICPTPIPDNAKAEIEDVIGIDATDAIACSAKTGMGIDDILEAMVARMPPPKRQIPRAPLRAMIIDSWFDTYVGVVMLVRVVDGRLAKGERIKMMATGAMYNADNLGVFTPANQPRESLEAGEVGYIIAGIKELQAAKVGDTITLIRSCPTPVAPRSPPPRRLPGFKEIQPQVFAGLYPTEANQYDSAARRAGKAQAQRRLAALRARGVAGAGLRLSLRLPGPAAHGDRAGAPGARVRPGPDHHRAQRGVRGGQGRRRGAHGREPVQDAGPGPHSRKSASPSSPCTCTCRRTTWARDDAGQPEAGRADEHGLPRRRSC
jgi:hypothetical protein